MSKVDDIFALISQGLHPSEVAKRLGCKERYVSRIGGFKTVEAYREARRVENLAQRKRARDALAVVRAQQTSASPAASSAKQKKA